MNLNEIQDLIKFVAKSGVSEVEIEQKDFKIVIKAENKSKSIEQPVYIQAPQAVQQIAPAAAPAKAATPVETAPVSEESNYVIIKSNYIMLSSFFKIRWDCVEKGLPIEHNLLGFFLFLLFMKG